MAALLDCTAEWMRVLKPTGSLWVNLGDRYNSAASNQQSGAVLLATRGARRAAGQATATGGRSRATDAVPGKSLLGLPWRYAIGCTDDLGLILRAEVLWSKPNGLPESVTDRVRRSHEQFFHFTKQPRYYAAVDEIRQPHSGRMTPNIQPLSERLRPALVPGNTPRKTSGRDGLGSHPLGKLPGSVWEVAAQPLRVPAELEIGHFAAFPPALVEPIILGWSPPGICTACGEGRRPVPASTSVDMSRPQARRAMALVAQHGLTEEHIAAIRAVGVSDTGRGAATQTGTGKNTEEVHRLAAEARAVLGGYAREFLQRPTSFTYVCNCSEPSAPTRPAVVLDPFGGTGTTALVASVHGRYGISVDRSADYCRLAAWRVNDPGERARALGVPPPPPVPEGQDELFEVIA